MAGKKLSHEEQRICARFREARERLGLTQAEAAKLTGITRERVLIYEYKRAPLKFDIALKFCRQLVISEEWLATGQFDSIETVAGGHDDLKPIYFRHCLDLQSEPEFLQVAPGTLFSVAYRETLGAKYAALVAKHTRLPRLIMRDSDTDDLLCRYLTVVMERYFLMLENEARRLAKPRGFVRREFLRCTIDFSTILFKRYLGMDTPEVEADRYNFLRLLANSSSEPLGFLHGNH